MHFRACTVFLVSIFLFAISGADYDPQANYTIQVADSELRVLTVRSNVVTVESYNASDYAQKFHLIKPSNFSSDVLIVNVQPPNVTCVKISGNDCNAHVSITAGICNILATEKWNIASNTNGSISSTCNQRLVMRVQSDNTVTVEDFRRAQSLFNIFES